MWHEMALTPDPESESFVLLVTHWFVLFEFNIIKKALGDDSMSEAQIKLWYRRFKDGRESVGSDRRSEVLQNAEHPKMLKEFRLQSTKSGD
jgi:hypothetical protein